MNKLNELSNVANEKENEKHENKLFVNLSIKEIFYNLIETIIDILNEILDLPEKRDINNYLQIFFQKDRMIYVGIFLIIISILFYI